MSDTITCPKCNTEIPLSEAISHQVEERLRADFLAQKDQLLADQAEQLAAKDTEREAAITTAREDAVAAAEVRATEQVSVRLRDLETQAEEQEALRKEAEERELALLSEKRKLVATQQGLELKFQRQLDDERAKIEAGAKEQSDEQWKLKLRERELQLEQMQARIEDLQAAADQKRSGLQGEVLEREIEDVLHEQFPIDVIEPVKSGARGADVLQRVRSSRGECGTLLWESKRQKHWSDGWLDKLRSDRLAAKASVGIIVTSALPDGVEHLDFIGDLWVCDFASVVPLARMLRQQLDAVAQAKLIEMNRSHVADEVYEYICGQEFQRYVTDAVLSAVRMKNELDAERIAQARMFAKRETQIEAQLRSFAGLYGGLQGIAGGALQPVAALELPVGDGEEPLALAS